MFIGTQTRIPEKFPCTMAGFVRSLFGVGESRDRGESERLQKYEDRVDQGYDPFHHKCGKKVVFSAKGRLIAATSGIGLGGGRVYSANPIPVGTMFQVKLLEKQDGWLYSLVSPCTE